MQDWRLPDRATDLLSIHVEQGCLNHGCADITGEEIHRLYAINAGNSLRLSITKSGGGVMRATSSRRLAPVSATAVFMPACWPMRMSVSSRSPTIMQRSGVR